MVSGHRRNLRVSDPRAKSSGPLESSKHSESTSLFFRSLGGFWELRELLSHRRANGPGFSKRLFCEALDLLFLLSLLLLFSRPQPVSSDPPFPSLTRPALYVCVSSDTPARRFPKRI